jgi:cytochrome c556
MLFWLLFLANSSGHRLTESNAAVAKAQRDLWQSVQKLPIGYDITTQCLEQLKADLSRDPAGVREALGEADLRLLQERIQKNDEVLAKRKEALADIEVKKKEVDQLLASMDKTLEEAHKITAIANRYDDALKKAMAAVKEKRRIAPVGNYILKIDYDEKPNEDIELALLIALTQLECLAEDNITKTGDHYARHFDGVTKDYADKMGERFRTAGANVSIEKTVK